MKRATLCIAIFVSLVMCLSIANAKMNEDDLKKQVTLTEEATLLTQVDAVSLYMTSDRVAHVPRLSADKVIVVEVTVLADDLLSDKARLKSFISRQIDTFISVLKERMPIYAPSIASSFDPKNDIRFVVNAGVERQPLASREGGSWKWEKGFDSVELAYAMPAPSLEPQAPEVLEPKEAPKGKLGCNCPARKKMTD